MIDEVREPAPEGTSFALLVLGLLSTLERFERSLAAPTAAPARGPATLEPSPAGDPALLAGSLSGAPGDGGNVLRFLRVENATLGELEQRSLDEYLSDVVSGVALEIDASKSAREAEQFLLDGLEARRDQVSGVNTDEELVHMIEQEQAYQTAAQYLRVVNELTAELMNIL